MKPGTAVGGAEGGSPSSTAVCRLWGRGVKWTQPADFLALGNSGRTANGKATSGVCLQGVAGRLLHVASHVVSVTVSAKRSRK